jgi:hypothetical protein
MYEQYAPCNQPEESESEPPTCDVQGLDVIEPLGSQNYRLDEVGFALTAATSTITCDAANMMEDISRPDSA